MNTFPTIYCLCGNTVKFSHESNIFLFKKYATQTNGNDKPQNLPFSLRHVDLHLIHPSLDHSAPQTTAQSIHTLPHNYATKSPLATMRCHTFTLKTAPPSSMITTLNPPSNTPILRPTPFTAHSLTLITLSQITAATTDHTDQFLNFIMMSISLCFIILHKHCFYLVPVHPVFTAQLSRHATVLCSRCDIAQY